MKYPMYSIRDKATCFMQPVCEQTEKTAIRNFSVAVNNGALQFQCEDFDLYKIGYFDGESGELEHILPEFVCNGANLKKVTLDEV